MGVVTWAVLLHPPYSPGLASSDFPLFGPLKDAVRGRRFESDDDVVCTVRTLLRQQDKEWYQSCIHALVPRWRKAIELHGKFVEN
jgi:histone-lysine N-methyltransferase SETMAR